MKGLRYGMSLKQTLQLGEMQNMTAEELLARYHMVIYSPRDIDKINIGLNIIRSVLDKNNKKIKKEAQK